MKKNKKEFIITCDCGCGKTFVFRNDFDVIWVESLNSCFYSKQENFKDKLSDKIKYIYKISKNKAIYLNELCITEDELIQFLSNLKELISTLPDEETENVLDTKLNKERNMLHLSCVDLKFSVPLIFSLKLKSSLTIKDIITNKEYRQYETSLTKEEVQMFIAKAEKFLKKMQLKKLKE